MHCKFFQFHITPSSLPKIIFQDLAYKRIFHEVHSLLNHSFYELSLSFSTENTFLQKLGYRAKWTSCTKMQNNNPMFRNLIFNWLATKLMDIKWLYTCGNTTVALKPLLCFAKFYPRSLVKTLRFSFLKRKESIGANIMCVAPST